MKENTFEIIFLEWKEKELAYYKQKKRKYLHFDERLAFPTRIQFFKTYLKNSEVNVPKHSFYPFIKSDIITPRLKVEKTGGVKRLIYKDKVRPIAYASHFDSYLYSWYSTVLTHLYSEKLLCWGINDCVLAYLKTGLCNINFAKAIFDYISNFGECVALAFDISSFFDGLDHDILKKMWGRVLNCERLPKDHWAVFKTLTDYTYVEKNDIEMVFPRPLDNGYKFERFCSPDDYRKYIRGEKLIQNNSFYNKVCDSRNYGKQCGIPQGSPISACLSNLYMIEFDQAINQLAKDTNSLYRRYCDDIVVVCPMEQKDLFIDVIQAELKRNELVVNPKKTEVSHFVIENGKLVCYSSLGSKSKMQYLGFEFDGQNVFIRSSSLSRQARRVNLKVGQAVRNAYDFRRGNEEIKIYRRGLYKALTELGNKNFISYASRAGEKIFKSESIKRQYKNSVKKVEKVIRKKIIKQEENLKKYQQEKGTGNVKSSNEQL